MDGTDQMTSMARFKRSCMYAAIAVIASAVTVFALSSLENPAKPSTSGTRAIDLATYVLGLPLGPGALLSFGIFGALRSCAKSTQILAIFLIPFISFPVDAGLIFVVWDFFHRKASRRLDSDGILHVN
jgi:hypothetical protein